MSPTRSDDDYAASSQNAFMALHSHAGTVRQGLGSSSELSAAHALSLLTEAPDATDSAWYTTVLPMRVGALIGSRGSADLKPMIDFGFFLGAAFQIHDDVLNLVGDPDVYGKEQHGDIREAKRTLIVIHLAAIASAEERAWLEQVLAPDNQRSEADIAEVVALMERHGSIEFAREFARGVADSARDAFAKAFEGATGPGKDFIEAMIPYMVDRAA